MSVDKLLRRLDRVRASGNSAWTARCPSHEDRSPSLSVRALDDGRILIHDFGGCPPADVLAAIGMELADLFPDRLGHRNGKIRDRTHRHAAVEALNIIAREALVVVIAADFVASGAVLDSADRKRLLDAAIRVRAATEAVKWAS